MNRKRKAYKRMAGEASCKINTNHKEADAKKESVATMIKKKQYKINSKYK